MVSDRHSYYSSLDKDLIGSTFGKISSSHLKGDDLKDHFKREDIAASLVSMICYNIGQLSYLCSCIDSVTRAYYVGNFIKGDNFVMQELTKAFGIFAEGEQEVCFLKHDGMLGALGCLISE